MKGTSEKEDGSSACLVLLNNLKILLKENDLLWKQKNVENYLL